MKRELPILFSTPMVQAIMDERKSQTRRMSGLKEINKNPDDWVPADSNRPARGVVFKNRKSGSHLGIFCPYGKPGDLLYVRETWWSGYILDENDHIPDNAKLEYWFHADTRDARPGDMSDSRCAFLFGNDKRDWPRWKPSIHMPKVAARIWLEVTDVRAERLHDITEEDAIAEGVEQWPDGNYKNYVYPGKYEKARDSFFSLWESINGRDSLQSNPSVFAVSYKVLSTTGKPEDLEVK